ncbi:MAG TPA: polysaccharide biosynthesis/export family protein [Candidatus Binatia bacterium]|nr:polysaccharide biosynthesis/export family protein [Candidatus Binatia bacterium]
MAGRRGKGTAGALGALAGMVVALGTMTGCAAQRTTPLPATAAAPLGEYRIGRSDDLSIKFFYTPELNEDVVVRPDGNISLQLVGDVPVAGRTPAEVSADIKQRYQPKVQTRDVTVIVRDSKSARAFVGGEVKQPAMVAIDGAMSVVDAIFMAGGALETAQLQNVVLLRIGPNGKEAHLVDVKDGLAGGEPVPTLQPYDVVYVPKSVIGELNTFVELYVNRMIPKNSGFFAYYQINPVPTVPTP